MKASELIAQLQGQIARHGDLPVFTMGRDCPELVDEVQHDKFFEDGLEHFFLHTDPHKGWED